MDIDNLEIQISAESNKADIALNKLISSLQKLSSALNGINPSGLQGLSNAVKKFSSSMQAMNNVKTADFTRLAKNIQKLASINTASLNSASSAMATIGRALNNLGTVSSNATQIGELAKNIAKLGNKSVQNAITNLPALSTALKNMLSTLQSAPRVSNNLIQMTNALANLASQGQRVGSATRGLSSNLKTFGNSADSASKKSKSLASAIGLLYAKFWMLQRALSGLWGAIEKSMDFLETVNYFEVAMDKVGKDSASKWKENGYESAEVYADSFSRRAKELTTKMSGFEIDTDGNTTMINGPSLGIDPDAVMNAQAVFAQMANSIGLTGETALRTSNALTMLGADWASLRNIGFDEAWTKFQSALAGETEAVRALGIDVTQTTLAMYAQSYGLKQNISDMDRATKTQLTLIAMLEQSRVAWGDLANTMSSPSNQLRLLQGNMVSLARSIGNLFIPILSKVLPYINGFVIALQRLFQWIGGLLGIEFSSINSAVGGVDNSLGGVSDSVGSVNDGLDDTGDSLDDANKKAKKLKRTILGFDQLNVLTDNSDSDSSPSSGKDSNSGSGIGGGGSPILDAAIADLLSEYEKAWNSAFEKMENKAQSIADDITKAFQKLYEIAEPTRESIKKLWDEGLSKFADFTWTALKDFWTEFLKPLGKWTLGKGLPSLIDAVNDFLNDIDWKKINSSLRTFWRALEPFTESVGTGLIKFYKDLLKVGAQFINKTIPTGLDALSKALKNIKPSTAEKIGYSLGVLFTSITAFKGLTWISSVLGANSALNKGLALLATHPYIALGVGIAGVVVALDKFGVIDVDWNSLKKSISNLFDAISDLADEIDWETLSGAIIKFVGALARITVDIGQGIIDFAAKITDLLTPVLSAGIDLVSVALSAFADVLNSMSDETIKNIGEALAALFAIWKIKETIDTIKKFASSLAKLKDKVTDLAKAKISDVKDNLSNLFSSLSAHPYEAIAIGVAAVGAALVLAIKNMKDEADEQRMKTMFDTLSSIGTLAVSELSDSFIELANNVSSSMESTNEKINSISSTNSSIETTAKKISKIQTSIENGAYTAEEKIPEITELFNQLLADTKSIFDQEYDLIVEGLAGSLGDTLEAMGQSTPELTTLLAKVRDSGKEAVETLTTQLSELEKQHKSGKLSAEEYYKKQTELYQKLNELTIDTTPLEEAGKSFTKLKEKVNFSDWVKDGALDASALDDTLTSMSNAFGTAEENINTSIDGTQEAIQDYLNYMKSVPDEFSDSDIKKMATLVAGNESERKNQISTLKGYFKQITDKIQTDLLEQIPSQIEASKKDYKNQSWIYKRFVSESAHVEQTLRDYESNVIAPVEEKLKESLEAVGLDGSTFAGEAGESIINSLFENIKTYSIEGIPSVERILKNDFGSVFEKSMKEVGKNASQGLADGIESNSKEVEKASKEIANKVPEQSKSTLDIHSPSRVMKKIGAYATQGLVDGIKSLASDLQKAAKSLVTDFTTLGKDTIKGLRSGWDSLKESKIGKEIAGLSSYAKTKAGDALTWLKQKGKDTVTGLRNGWDALKDSKIGKEMSDLPDYLKTKMGKLNEKVETKGKEIINGLKSGWSAVKESNFGSEVAKIADYTKTKMGDLKEKIKSKGEQIVSGLGIGYSEKWKSSFSETLSKTGNKISSGIGSISKNENIKSKGGQIVSALKAGWNEKKAVLNEWLSSIPDLIAKGIGSLWDAGKKLASDFVNGLKSVSIPTLNIKTKTTNTSSSSGIHSNSNPNASTMSLNTPSIQAFATGGFPNTGQMFIANEAGPELVGKIGKRNAVANNMQITDGIADAVAPAVYEAVTAAMKNSNSTNSDNPIVVEAVLKVGEEAIARAVAKGQRKLNRRMSPVAT